MNDENAIIEYIAKMVTSREEVSGLAGGFAHNLSEKVLGGHRQPGGIRISKDGDAFVIDIHLMAFFGYNISEMCFEIQHDVKKGVEELTGQKVSAVNVGVEGVRARRSGMSNKMNRDKVREKVMHVFFEMDAQNEYDYEKISMVGEDAEVMKSSRAVEMFKAFRDHHDRIDQVINDSAKGWTVKRMARTDLAILRTAVCEILYIDDIPVPVSINEAVELAKRYGDDHSYAFVNGVLRHVSELCSSSDTEKKDADK